MAGTLPPIFPITDDDHGGYTAVALYTLLALSVFVVATRLSARYYIGKVVQIDDFLLGGATVSTQCFKNEERRPGAAITFH